MEDVEGLLAQLADWTAEARVGSAAQSRVRERWLRQQAVEDARFAGLALDLAERRAGVVVGTTGGRSLRGRIAAVGRDFCLVRSEAGQASFVALSAVASLRPEPGGRAGDAASDRSATQSTTLVEVLSLLAADRPRVRVVLVGGEVVAGELRAVGDDVVTLRLDGGPAAVYVRTAAVTEVALVG